MTKLNISVISDLHGQYERLQMISGDILFCAGDLLSHQSIDEVKRFCGWFGNLNYKYKIVIAGNHDDIFRQQQQVVSQIISQYPIVYLCHQHYQLSLNGCNIRIFGTPLYNNRHRNPDGKNFATSQQEKLNIIEAIKSQQVDVLMTHGPCYGILDKNYEGLTTGCKFILNGVKQTKPKLHIFGHIHEARGTFSDGNTIFLNASISDQIRPGNRHPVQAQHFVWCVEDNSLAQRYK